MASSFFTRARTIAAIGRNYAAHAKELGNAVPTSPFFFLKPPGCMVRSGEAVQVPKGVEAHFEVELGVIIGKKATNVSKADASKYIGGYALAIDMTARNMQDVAKKAGLPWSAAKGLDTFCPISDMISVKDVKDHQNMKLWLKVNGETKQSGNTSDMIFDIPSLLAHVSSIMTLNVGDVLLTGTPPGVGPVRPGDRMTAGIANGDAPDGEHLAELDVPVVEREGGFVFSKL